jgi:hypothetical protein
MPAILLQTEFAMADIKPRTRAVIFRLTQDEYNRVKSASHAGGARSLSDFARANVLRAAGEPTLGQMERKLDELHRTVRQLAEKLTGD